MTIQLSNDERDVLIALLDSAIAETRQEIYHTEKHAFKEAIKTKKYLLEGLLERFIRTQNLSEHMTQYPA